MFSDVYIRFLTEKPENARAILWPVQVCTVLVQESRTKILNLFQKVIMELSLARCRDPKEISGLLGLSTELVDLIMSSQLVANGWMDEKGVVTEIGERVLKDDLERLPRTRCAYAYWDRVSGKLLPRFYPVVRSVVADDFRNGGYPVFLVNRDSGALEKPYVLVPRHEQLSDLSSEFDAGKELLDAARLYTRDRRRSRGFRAQDFPEVDVDDVKMINAVSHSNLRNAYLWTWLYRSPGHDWPWLVADPFGYQDAVSWLREPLLEEMKGNPGLCAYAASLIDKEKPAEVSAEAFLQGVEDRSRLIMQAKYGEAMRVPMIADYLGRVIRMQDEMSKLSRVRPEELSSLLMESHNLVESVLKWLLRTFKMDDRRVPRNGLEGVWTKGVASELLSGLGLSFLDESTIRRLSSQRLWDIRRSAIDQKGALKALLFAVLLSTGDHPTHPFNILAGSGIPIAEILDLADARNKGAGHANEGRVDEAQVRRYSSLAVNWVKIFNAWY